MKLCIVCNQILPLDDFRQAKHYRTLADGTKTTYRLPFSYCRPCQNKKTKLYAIKARRLAHEAGVKHYGGQCICCGLQDFKFLTIDHINGRDPDEKRLTGEREWVRLKKLNWPTDIQLLCFNCNCAKGIYGVCPHQENSDLQGFEQPESRSWLSDFRKDTGPVKLCRSCGKRERYVSPGGAKQSLCNPCKYSEGR